MTLTRMERAAYNLFHRTAAWQRDTLHPDIGVKLRRAGMMQEPLVYLSYLDLVALVTLLEGALLALMALFVLPSLGVALPLPGVLAAAMAPVILPLLVYAIGLARPEVRSSERATLIDVQLPNALNYMAALASSGTTPDRILASLGRQAVYGEVAREAHAIAVETQHTGKDLITALRDAIPRTPSTKFQDILQGMMATVGSGASLKEFLLTKAEQMHRENVSMQKRNVESLGVLAESFMVIAVAAPVFLIIMLTVMGASGPGGGSATFLIMWFLVLGMVPGAQAGFAIAVHSMRGRL